MYRNAPSFAGIAVVVAVAAALAGCSSGAAAPSAADTTASAVSSSAPAGNAGLSGNEILVNFKQAINEGTAVHVNGVLTSGGQTVTLDLYLNKGADASGSIGSAGATIPFRSVGGVDYYQFTDSVLKLAGVESNPQAVAVLRNKWVSSKSHAGSSMESAFNNFTSYDAFLDLLIGNPVSGSNTGMAFAVASGTSTLNGQQVAVYTDSENATVYFPVTGLAYLIEIRTSDPGPTGIDTLTFTWNQPTKVAVPPKSDIYTG